MRKLLVAALGLGLTGCSHSPPSLATWHPDGDRLVFDEGSTPRPPLGLVSLRTTSEPPHEKPHAAKSAKPRSDHAEKNRNAKIAAARMSAAKSTSAPSRPLSPAQPRAPAAPEPLAAAPAHGDAAASSGAPPPDRPQVARSIQQEVAAASADAERSNSAATPDDAEGLVAVLMTRLNITDVSDLTAKSVAVDARFAASAGMIRTAIVAAGAREVQLSEARTAAIDRLANGEVPAAIVALAPAETADAFPDVTGFRIFRVPLSPRALKPRP